MDDVTVEMVVRVNKGSATSDLPVDLAINKTFLIADEITLIKYYL